MTELGQYHLELAGEARRDLHRLPGRVATAIIEFITGALAGNPALLNKPLTNELAAHRSARPRRLYRVAPDTSRSSRSALAGEIPAL